MLSPVKVAPVEGALDLLNELKSFNMTLKLLQETRIGMSVNGIRKHFTDDVVVSLSKILIKDWKRLLDAARTQCTERPNEMKNGVDSNKFIVSPVRSPLEKDTSHKRLDVSDSDPESEKEEYSDKQRKEKHNVEHKKDERAVDLKKERYTEAFKNERHAEQSKNGKHNFKEFGTNCDSMAAEIEDHIFKEMGATDMKYKNRVRSRISNLKDPKNPGLRRNVLAGGIELRRFAIMSAEEMASDELKQLRNNLTKEAIREHQLSKTSGTIYDLFQCSKKNCTYNQMQTHSADEPMTTFVLCNECGNRWKFC
uniref:LOW QUALITY PROTEIN: transcription elongation factor A protein 3-like n=1 Tax=Oncorhynchus gorbuscha TaxID=8017 RepID=UPI001EAE9677|nr:LOW QUALITY PROTEIN: transcription elongation factor A protein 3-like [Oncorhynchus gorbuscha]